jgi:hypothetical protein
MPNNYLSLKDFLLVSEAVLGIAYEELERAVCIYRAQAALAAPFVRVCGVGLFEDPADQAAICAIRLLRTRPLPLGSASSRKVAYECMREMLVRGGCRWSRQMEDAEDVGVTLERVERGQMTDAQFLAWVRAGVRA